MRFVVRIWSVLGTHWIQMNRPVSFQSPLCALSHCSFSEFVFNFLISRSPHVVNHLVSTIDIASISHTLLLATYKGLFFCCEETSFLLSRLFRKFVFKGFFSMLENSGLKFVTFSVSRSINSIPFNSYKILFNQTKKSSSFSRENFKTWIISFVS